MNAQLLTVKDIENALQLSHTKTYELINAGEIETLKIGRRRMATQKSIDTFIERKLGEMSA